MTVLKRHTLETYETELRRLAIDPSTVAAVAPVVEDVRSRGWPAVVEHALRFGDVREPDGSGDAPRLVFDKNALRAAYDSLPAEKQGLLQRCVARVSAFAAAQRASLQDMTTDVPGGKGGHTCSPVARAGCYAPGGRYPLPSSVIMTVATARAAGVKEVWACSPRPGSVTLAAAHVAGADGVVGVGGAQAIACMAFGASSGEGLERYNGGSPLPDIPPCDVVVGPGNQYVTAAKSLVSGTVGIDMLAGPSEVLVVMDGTADPAHVAADLLAQAEHDTQARAILVAVSPNADEVERLISSVEKELETQLASLSTRETASVAIAHSYAVGVPDIRTAADVCNAIAPEHLQLLLDGAAASQEEDQQGPSGSSTGPLAEILPLLESYGGLFIGGDSAEVLGDYCFGPNHTLPTAGTAKYTGGLSVFTFVRIRTWLRVDARACQPEIADAVALAREEGLAGHASAAERRLKK